MMPQKPGRRGNRSVGAGCGHGRLGRLIPFISVIRSARCMARISEKWPVSEESRSFCLSYAVVARGNVSALFLVSLP